MLNIRQGFTLLGVSLPLKKWIMEIRISYNISKIEKDKQEYCKMLSHFSDRIKYHSFKNTYQYHS